MKPVVLIFAGSIASGKSTLAQEVATALSWPVTSFGEYVRTIAHQQGRPPSRAVLQAVGADLIAAGWEPFCRAVLAQVPWRPGQSIVVEGVRHAEALPTLRRLTAPAALYVIYITIDPVVQQTRLQARGNDDALPLVLIEQHSTESQVKSQLTHLADIQVDGNRPIEELIAELCRWVAQQEDRV